MRRNVVNLWEGYIAEMGELNEDGGGRGEGGVKKQVVTSVGGESEELYSFEELETLWFITKNVDYTDAGTLNHTRLMRAFESFIDELEPHLGASTEAWFKFVRKVPKDVRMRYLLTRKLAPSTLVRSHDGFAEDLWDVTRDRTYKLEGERLISEGVKGNVLPLRLHPAFLKDSSSDVRSCLASLRNLPAPVIELLIQDKNLSVVKTLAGNENIPGEFLEKIEQRLDRIDDGEEEVSQRGTRTGTIREKLGNNVNTSVRVLVKYMLTGRKVIYNKELVATYGNPNVPTEVKEGEVKRIDAIVERKIATICSLQNGSEDGEAGSGSVYDRVKSLKSDIDGLKYLRDVAVSYGCAPPDEVKSFVTQHIRRIVNTAKDDNLGAGGRYDFSLGDRLGRALSVGAFSSAELQSFYENLKGKVSFDVVAGLLANPQTSESVLKDFKQTTTSTSYVAREMYHYIKTLNYVNDRLRKSATQTLPPLSV